MQRNYKICHRGTETQRKTIRRKNKINMAKESMKTGNNIPLFMLS